MVLVRPTTVFAVVSGAFPPRNQLALYGMQIVSKTAKMWWAEKAAWFRNVPWTAIEPTLGQLEVRIHFGELAKKAKELGAVGTREKPAFSKELGRSFVGAAAYIADNMKGFRAPHAIPKEEYPSKKQRTFKTYEERKRELEARLKALA